MDKKIGTCGLCHKQNVELQSSHLFPAAAYKRLLNPSTKSPHPVLVTPKAAFQTSWQTQDYFLCSDCEQRFSKNGENWIMKNCWQDEGIFPLQEALKNSSHSATTPGTSIYVASRIKEIDVAKLAYFAVSVFWRASAHEWTSGKIKTMPKGMLEKYEDGLRPYLLEQQDFPSNAALLVSVPISNDAIHCCNMIEPARGGPLFPPCIFTRCIFLGIGFQFFVSENLDKRYIKDCLIHGDLITRTIGLDVGMAFRWTKIAKGRDLP